MFSIVKARDDAAEPRMGVRDSGEVNLADLPAALDP
jgi:hypothetical protein